MSAEVRALLEGRKREADTLKATGTIVPWVFWRMVAKGRRGTEGYTTLPKRMTTFGKVWKNACKAAGLPWSDTPRPAAHGRPQLHPRRYSAARGAGANRPPDRRGVQPLQHRQRGRSR